MTTTLDVLNQHAGVGSRSRLRISGLLAGVVFLIGLGTFLVLPGGGDVTDKQFTDFYNSGGHRATAVLLYLVLVAGAWLVTWFFGELRALGTQGRLGDVASRVSSVGTAAVIIGGAVALGPTGVQTNSGQPFVGVSVADTFAQAGMFTLIIGGIFSYGLALFLSCLDARRAGGLSGWATMSGMVVAVLLVGAYIALPAVLLPLWMIVVALAARPTPTSA